MKMVHLIAAVATFGVLQTVLAAEDWFGVSFDRYAVGESLSDKGAVGGSWGEQPVPENASATNRQDGGVSAIAFNTLESDDGLNFTAGTASTDSLSTIDVKLFFETPSTIASLPSGSAFAFTIISDSEGDNLGFAVATGDGIFRMTAAGIAPELERWYDLRTEIRMVDNARFVRFSLKGESGYVGLVTSGGLEWLFVDYKAAEGVSEVGFIGVGRFSAFNAIRDAGQPETGYHWIGEPDADWDDGANWSLSAGGEPCGTVPDEGAMVFFTGTFTVTRNGKKATLRNLVASVEADGLKVVSGSVRTEVSLDTDRPVVGETLTADVPAFGGYMPPVTMRWRRGSTAMAWEAEPVSTTASYTPTAADFEHWFRFEVADDAGVVFRRDFFFSKLPVFYMTTDDGLSPSAQKEEHNGKLRVQGNAEWESFYDGKMKIKVRGNSTKGLPKKPYKIKLDKKPKTDIFGMPTSKHWVLLANYIDESQMRNKLAYDFANEIGALGMRSTWVDCVLNGEWLGCYQFCEHIRIDKARVSVYNWEDAAESVAEKFAEKHGFEEDEDALDKLTTKLQEDFSWITTDSVTYPVGGVDQTENPSKLWKKFTNDITGGYLLEFSNEMDELTTFEVKSGKLVLKTMVNSPEYLFSNDTMTQWLKDFLRDYCEGITAADGYSANGKHYSELCDIDSMARYFLVMEMFGNNDAIYKSRYAYKDQGKKMTFGPVWDFDWGVASYKVGTSATGWKVQNHEASFYREWADDPNFCTRLCTLYPTARAEFAKIVAENGLIDTYFAFLAEAGAANTAKWKTSDHRGFTEDVRVLKTYLTSRLIWLDAQFKDVPTLMASLNTSSSSSPYSPDATSLPIAFANLNAAGKVYDGQSLRLVFTVGDASAARVRTFVNGPEVGGPVEVVDGKIDVVLPAAALTAAKGEPNCISLIAYTSDGTLKSRNYALVTVADWDGAATEPQVDAAGSPVPSVPYEWIRDAAVEKRPSLAYATEPEFAAVILEKPSPWGKAMPLWQDFVAGTNPDPNGENAKFEVTRFEIVDGEPQIEFSPNLGDARVYRTYGRTDLVTGDWQTPPPANARFFKLTVELPPAAK